MLRFTLSILNCPYGDGVKFRQIPLRCFVPTLPYPSSGSANFSRPLASSRTSDPDTAATKAAWFSNWRFVSALTPSPNRGERKDSARSTWRVFLIYGRANWLINMTHLSIIPTLTYHYQRKLIALTNSTSKSEALSMRDTICPSSFEESLRSVSSTSASPASSTPNA